MLIPVIFKNGQSGLVETSQLDELISSRKILSFLRLDGWVVVGRDPMRKGLNNSVHPGRRHGENRLPFELNGEDEDAGPHDMAERAFGKLTFRKIREIARQRGIKTGRMKRGDLIRAIQRAEGNEECFGTVVTGDCSHVDCMWREYCLT